MNIRLKCDLNYAYMFVGQKYHQTGTEQSCHVTLYIFRHVKMSKKSIHSHL